MAVNQQNASFVGNFSLNPIAHYAGAAGVMPGAAQFISSVLCRVRQIEGAGVQTLLANLDVPNFAGHAIAVEENAGTYGEGHVILHVFVGDGAAVQEQEIDLGPGPIGKLMLIHLAVSNSDDFRVYVNAGLVGTVALGDPAVGSTLAPRVGAIDAAGADPASASDVLGVAYLQSALSNVVIDSLVAGHFDACHRALAMASLSQFTTPPVAAFTNRFDVRNGAVVLGRPGTLFAPVPGAVSVVPPGPATTWQPSEGAATLTKLGPEPTTVNGAAGLQANVITNPVWAYTPANVPAPQA